MSGLRALIVLETCRLRNTVRSIIQKPSRLGSWLFFLFWLAFSTWTRSQRHTNFFPLLTQQFAAIALGAILVWLGIRTFIVVFARVPPVRATPVEAVFLERSAIDERLIFFWLFLGSIAKQSVIVAGVVLVLLVNLGRNPQAFTVLNLTAILLLIEIAAIPAYLAGRISQILARIATGTIAACGLVLIALALLAPDRVSSYSLFFTRIWSGDPSITEWFGLGILVALACSFFVRDFFPELYRQGIWAQSWRQQLATRRAVRYSGASSVSAQRSPLRGPLVEIWKQLAYLRRGNGRTIAIALIVLGPVLGAVEAYLVRHNPEVAGIGASFAAIAVVTIVSLSSLSLAGDIAKPIWWMVDGSLFAHLCAWTAAGVLPIVFVIVTACLTTSLLLGNPLIFVLGTLYAVTVPPGMRTIAMLGYAISPAKADQRGPGMLIRMVIVYLTIAVSAGGAVLGVIIFRGLIGGLLCGILAFVLVAALALALTVQRVGGRGIELALAENA